MSHGDAPVWRRGIVHQVDAAKGRVKVLLPDEDGILTDWLPVLVPFTVGAKAFWLPRPESQVVVLLDETAEDGAVLGALYSSADPAPAASPRALSLEWEDGTKILVDPDAGQVTVDTPGNLLAKAGGQATVQAPTITLQGNVTVTGNLAVNQDATVTGKTTTAQAVIGGKDFASHKHQAQGATAITTQPI